MFTLSKDNRDNRDYYGRRNSRDGPLIERQMEKRGKSQFILKNLLYKRCKLCSTMSKPCQNCCPLPINFDGNKKKKQHNLGDFENSKQTTTTKSTSSTNLFKSLISDQEISKETSKNINKNYLEQSSTSIRSSSTNMLDKMEEQSERNFAKPSAPTEGSLYLDTDKGSDITILIGPEQESFPCHSRFLKNGSIYFQKTISDQNNNQEIWIKWLNPKKFIIIKSYLYTGEITENLTIDDTLELLLASIRLEMERMKKDLLNILIDECKSDNVLKLLEFFRDNPDELKNVMETYPLIEKVFFDTITENASDILNSIEFRLLDSNSIIKIISSDYLNIKSEIEVYNAINDWSIEKCKQNGKEITPENKKTYLNIDNDNILYYVRYLTMKLNEFLDGPSKDGILSKEINDVLIKKLTGTSIELPKEIQNYKMDIPRRFPTPATGFDESGSNNFNDVETIKPIKIKRNLLTPPPAPSPSSSSPSSSKMIKSKSLSPEKDIQQKKKRSFPLKVAKNIGIGLLYLLD